MTPEETFRLRLRRFVEAGCALAEAADTLPEPVERTPGYPVCLPELSTFTIALMHWYNETGRKQGKK